METESFKAESDLGKVVKRILEREKNNYLLIAFPSSAYNTGIKNIYLK